MRLMEDAVLGEHVGWRLQFTVSERAIFEKAATIARAARRLANPTDGDAADEDTDTLLAEVEHSCQAIVDAPDGLVVDR